MVQGNTVRAKHMGRDIAASFKNMIGGELKGYTELLTESRREALFKDVQVTSLRQPTAPAAQPVPVLVCGEVVIASDAFKSWASGLRNLFGGEAKNFGRPYRVHEGGVPMDMVRQQAGHSTIV